MPSIDTPKQILVLFTLKSHLAATVLTFSTVAGQNREKAKPPIVAPYPLVTNITATVSMA
jgi:hypothetical protein